MNWIEVTSALYHCLLILRIITRYNDQRLKGLGHVILDSFNAYKLIIEFNGSQNSRLKLLKKNIKIKQGR